MAERKKAMGKLDASPDEVEHEGRIAMRWSEIIQDGEPRPFRAFRKGYHVARRALESELAEAKDLLGAAQTDLSAMRRQRINELNAEATVNELASELAAERELRCEVTNDFADVANWLLSCGWHLPSFVHSRIAKLKQRMLDAMPSPPIASVATAEQTPLCETCHQPGCPRSVFGPDTYCDGYKLKPSVQAAPAAVGSARMLGPAEALRRDLVAAAREAGADRFPWVRFANLLEGKNPGEGLK